MTQTISAEDVRKAAEAAGFTELSKDHPLYSEGASIIFSSRMPKQSEQMSDSPTGDEPEDSNR